MKDKFGNELNVGDTVIFIQRGFLRLGVIETVGTDAVRIEYVFNEHDVDLGGCVTRPFDQVTFIDEEQNAGIKQLMTDFGKEQ